MRSFLWNMQLRNAPCSLNSRRKYMKSHIFCYPVIYAISWDIFQIAPTEKKNTFIYNGRVHSETFLRSMKRLSPSQWRIGILDFVEHRSLYLPGCMGFFPFLFSGPRISKRRLHDAMNGRRRCTVLISANSELNVVDVVLRSFGYRPVWKKSNRQEKIVQFSYDSSNRISSFSCSGVSVSYRIIIPRP